MPAVGHEEQHGVKGAVQHGQASDVQQVRVPVHDGLCRGGDNEPPCQAPADEGGGAAGLHYKDDAVTKDTGCDDGRSNSNEEHHGEGGVVNARAVPDTVAHGGGQHGGGDGDGPRTEAPADQGGGTDQVPPDDQGDAHVQAPHVVGGGVVTDDVVPAGGRDHDSPQALGGDGAEYLQEGDQDHSLLCGLHEQKDGESAEAVPTPDKDLHDQVTSDKGGDDDDNIPEGSEDNRGAAEDMKNKEDKAVPGNTKGGEAVPTSANAEAGILRFLMSKMTLLARRRGGGHNETCGILVAKAALLFPRGPR